MQHPQIIPAARGVTGLSRDKKTASGWGLSLALAAAAVATALWLPLAPAHADPLPRPALETNAVQKFITQAQKAEVQPVWGERNDKHRQMRRDRARVPAVCAIDIGGRHDVKVYSENCMKRQGVRAKLPRDCAASARIFGARDKVYGERCLRQAGFDMPR